MSKPTPEPADNAPDEELVAYLDGEIDESTAREIERKLASDPITRTKIQTLKKTYELLDYLPKPEPSSDFATKTMTHIQPASRSSKLTSSRVASYAPGIAWPWLTIASAVAVILGLLVGFATRSGTAKEEPLTPDLLPVLARLPFYLGVDDLEFLRKLDRPDLFGDDPNDAVPASPVRLDRTITPEMQTKHFEQYRALTPARRNEIVQLDKQFRELPDVERMRLSRVLEEYAIWLDRLPDPLRKEVLDATNRDDRLKAIETVQIKEWQETLPTEKRDKLRVITDVEEKAKLIRQWIDVERERKLEWQLAARQWQSIKDGKKPWPFVEESLRGEVDSYVKTVLKTDASTTRLSTVELQRLNFLRKETESDRAWLQYGALLLELSDRHPSLPESRNGSHITKPDQLPDSLKRQIQLRPPYYARNFEPKVGRWPDFALAVHLEFNDKKLNTLPRPGPCKPGDFVEPVDLFLKDELQPKLTAEQKRTLRMLEGKWPEYPREMLKLAKSYDLPVPGVTLPGPPKLWQQYYRYTPPKPEKSASRVTPN